MSISQNFEGFIDPSEGFTDALGVRESYEEDTDSDELSPEEMAGMVIEETDETEEEDNEY